MILDGPRLVEALQPAITMPVHRNLALRCQADTEEVLDVAYIWTHNGMRIRDYDVMHNNRMVRRYFKIVVRICLHLLIICTENKWWILGHPKRYIR